MSDLDLRELRREAAANPNDVARGRKLAAALERSGDRRGAFLEHCRLARLGDGVAQQRVLAWAPWSSEHGQGHARRARRAGIEGTPRVEWYAAGPETLWLARDDDALVFRGAQGRPSVRGLDGELHWAYTGELPEPIGRLELVGDDVLWLGYEQILLFDGVRGTIVAEARVPHPLQEAGLRGDRLVAVSGGGEDSPAVQYAIDVGRDFGQVVWETRNPIECISCLVAGAWAWLYVLEGNDTVARVRVETGAFERLCREMPGDSADEHGLIILSNSPLELDAREGRLRWNRPELSVSKGALTRHAALAEGSHDLVALDRETGQIGWSVSVESGPMLRELVVADGVAYRATWSDRLTIVAYDLVRGAERFRAEYDPGIAMPRSLRLIPLERALVVEARGPTGEGIIGVLSEG